MKNMMKNMRRVKMNEIVIITVKNLYRVFQMHIIKDLEMKAMVILMIIIQVLTGVYIMMMLIMMDSWKNMIRNLLNFQR